MKKKNSFIISLVLIPIMFVMIILASCGKTNLSNNSNEHNSTVKTEYTEEKYFEFSKMVEGYSVSLKEMPSSTTTIRIPNKYNNEPIIAIDENGFKDFTKITKIIIPNSVESIGDSAFSGCSSLESITIPFVGATATGNENKHFGYIFGASSYKENSKYVPTTLKEVIITSVTSIGDLAFYECSSLKSINIPASVTSIGERAFSECSSLKSINIPTSVINIDEYAFLGCSSLVIYCEASSKRSGWNSNWNYVDWNSNSPVYWGINENTYKEENGLQYVIQDGNAILTRYVGNETTTEITSTIQMNGKTYNVTSIGEWAFRDCSSLERIIIPNSVESIGYGAFSGCSSLESITIPFVGATATGNENKHFGYIFGASSSNDNSYYVPTTLKEVIITSVTSIGERAFYSCYSLESITIPNSVTSIGERAFYDCDSLESIVIPNSVTSIGDSAFHGCSSLSVVTIDKESNLQSIEETAFFECSSLESIVIPTSVTSIGYRAFAYCSSLTIYCEASSRQSGWDNDWNRDWNERPVYWKGQWHYDEYGNPVPNE